MHVFVTGATGWIGSALVRELVGAGHRVTGLTRSEEKAAALAASGATVLRGTLDDLGTLRDAAAAADAVAHTAFDHDFSKFAENSEQDRRAIEAMGNALLGSDRLLLVTSGVALVAQGRVATERDAPPAGTSIPRKSEVAAQAMAARGVRAATVRLAPSVHGAGERHGFVPILIARARDTGVSAYIDGGLNRWPGVHRLDAARLYRLALERGEAAVYHGVADGGVPFKAIAEVIGRRLGLPVESRDAAHFGWFSGFAGLDMPASSAATRAALGWAPTGPDLLTDIDQPGYFAV